MTYPTTWSNLLAHIDILLANDRAILAQGAKIMSKLTDAVAAITQAVTDAATELSGAQVGAFVYNITTDDGADAPLLYAIAGAPRPCDVPSNNRSRIASSAPPSSGLLPLGKSQARLAASRARVRSRP
jgi:hypothetical protein